MSIKDSARLPRRILTMPALLDSHCSQYFRWRDLFTAGATYQRLTTQAAPDSPLAPLPAVPESWSSLASLAMQLDFVVGEFGTVELTYGFAPPALTRHIAAGIAPQLDQHAASELGPRGKQVCSRGGAAADFRVPGVSMAAVARWVIEKLHFDRVYYYGADRPLHVSWHEQPSREHVYLDETSGRRLPRRLRAEDLR